MAAGVAGTGTELPPAPLTLPLGSSQGESPRSTGEKNDVNTLPSPALPLAKVAPGGCTFLSAVRRVRPGGRGGHREPAPAPGREFQPSRGCGHSPGPPARQEPAFRGLILSELFGERPRQRNEARPRPGPASGLRSVRLNKHCPSRPGRERVCAHTPVHVCVCAHVCGLCMCVPVCLCTSARVHLCVHVCLCAHECICVRTCAPLCATACVRVRTCVP